MTTMKVEQINEFPPGRVMPGEQCITHFDRIAVG
jgi:hypothetical protein